MSDLLKGLDAVIDRAREAGQIKIYSALIRKMTEEHKDSLSFEEIKAVIEEVQNNAKN